MKDIDDIWEHNVLSCGTVPHLSRSAKSYLHSKEKYESTSGLGGSWGGHGYK